MLKAVRAICQKYDLDYWLEGGSLLGAIRHQGFIPWDDDLDISMPRASFNQFLKIAAKELPNNLCIQTPQTDRGYFNLAVQLKIRDKNSRYVEKKERGDEPYQQGIYIDIFAYDKKPTNPLQQKLYKLLGKKLCRLLHHKYAPMYLQSGNHRRLYKTLSFFFPKAMLEYCMQGLISKANASNSPLLGYGYDCINNTQHSFDVFYPLKQTLFEGSYFNIPHRAEVILEQQFGDFWTLPAEEFRVLKHCRELIAEL